MTKRVKRDTSDMSFSLSRWFRKISEARPSAAAVIVTVVAFATFCLSGVVFQLIVQTPLTVYDGTRFHFVYDYMLDASGSGLSGQLGMDVVISAMLFTFGILGLLLMYQSTKSAYKPRNAYLSLIVGVTLLAFAYLFLEAVIKIKTG
jgi:hypothetical protein